MDPPAFAESAFVQARHDLFHRQRDGFEVPALVTTNSRFAETDDIAMPAGALRVTGGICRLDRYDFIDLIDCGHHASLQPALP